MNVEHLKLDTGVPVEQIEAEMSRLLSEGGGGDARLKRLGFIHLRYKGFSVKEAAEVVGVSVQMGYRWQSSWNSSGLEPFLLPPVRGRRSRLTAEQIGCIVETVSSQRMTTSEARSMVSEEYGIDYTSKQIHVILSRNGLVHSRPDGGGGPMVWTRGDRCYLMHLSMDREKAVAQVACRSGPATVKSSCPGE